MSSNVKFCKKHKMPSKVKMNSKAIVLKNKEKLFNMKGYRIEVDKDSYILFEKEEDYLKLFYLEKVFFDFYNNLFSDQEEIRLFFRLILIKKYIKSLSKINITILYNEKKNVNPFKKKFPNLSCIDCYKNEEEILEKIENLEKLEDKIFGEYVIVGEKLTKRIIVKYLRKYMFVRSECHLFNEF